MIEFILSHDYMRYAYSLNGQVFIVHDSNQPGTLEGVTLPAHWNAVREWLGY